MDIKTQSRHWVTNYEVIPSTGGATSAHSCTKCSVCNKCLTGKEAVSQGGRMHCWQCFIRIYAFTCASCSKIITGDRKVSFIAYNNQEWHTGCFRCSKCKRLLYGGEPIQEGKFLYCWGCNNKEGFLLG